MKRIDLSPVAKAPDDFSPYDLLLQTAQFAGKDGVPPKEIRERIRVMDAFEAAGPDAAFVDLEDADHLALCRAIEQTRWSVALRHVIAVLDRVEKAAEPPKGGK